MNAPSAMAAFAAAAAGRTAPGEPAPDLSPWLDAAELPWRFDFTVWLAADARQWRVLLARSDGAGAAALPRHALLADHPPGPHDVALRQALESRLRTPLAWVLCDAATLDGWLAASEQGVRALDALRLAGAAGDDRAGQPARRGDELSLASLKDQASPVLRLLESTLFDALRDAASDIHFETTARGLTVRLRIDGVLAEFTRVDGPAMAEQLVSRLKVMAELDIGERRLPQDGRFALRVAGREIDFRLSVMPSIHGEDAVVRVLDRAQLDTTAGGLTLEALGFEPADRAHIRRLALQPHGMLLVTGPTGSGKTTTLYAALSEVHTGRDKIITIEDPVEYELPGVVQIPVNDKKGLGFARGLRSILRHDPDRVMVGEIRDTETAQIAVQAALTGHLVFSTVHANHALDVIGRFTHMGLDLYNVASALNAVVAQRLLRRICPHCRVPHDASAAERARFGLDAGQPLWRASGCSHCRGTGYRGRHAVAELLLMDDELRDRIVARAPLRSLKALARERGLRSLREAALAAVAAGLTTLEELDRVTLAD